MNLAPNGKPSNLTPEQYKLVRTPAFKKWFGDWEKAYETGNYDNVSKVIDEETKEPLVVYHGTLQKFNVFNTYFDNGTWHGKGAYFTSSLKDLKTNYVTTKDDIYLECFLDIKNPIIVGKKYESTYFEKKDREIILQKLRNYRFPRVNYAYENSYDSDTLEKIIREEFNESKSGELLNSIYRELNFSGIIFLSPHKLKGHTAPLKTKHFVAFNSNQIKLADGTNTTFDSNNPDIRFELGGKVKSGEIVYHGSPYDFNQFTTARIGTGEGASGWGYGLYFSEDKEEANDYACKLETEENEGRVYTAKIPDSEKYLDFHAEFEQQSDYVKKALISIPKKYKIKLSEGEYENQLNYVNDNIDEYDFKIGDDEYWELVNYVLEPHILFKINYIYDRFKDVLFEGYEYETSEFLYKLGIKGIKHNAFGYTNFIVFNEDDIKMLKKEIANCNYKFGGIIQPSEVSKYLKGIDYSLKEVYPDIFLFQTESQKDLALSFARCQAFYEWDEFKGKKFTIKDFFTWYKFNHPNLKPYWEEFYGFNVPSDSIFDCYKVNEERNIYDDLLLSAVSKIPNKNFYLIGTVKGDDRALDHELAHAFFWKDEEYRNDMISLVNSIPNKDELLRILKEERGYGKDVLFDEAQAFLSTGLITEISDWQEYTKAFTERFMEQKNTNTTTFDGNNPDIRYKDGGEPNERTEWNGYKVGDVIESEQLLGLSGWNVNGEKGKKYVLIQSLISDIGDFSRQDVYDNVDNDSEYIESEDLRIEEMKKDFNETPPIPYTGDGLHRIVSAKELGHKTILMWKEHNPDIRFGGGGDVYKNASEEDMKEYTLFDANNPDIRYEIGGSVMNYLKDIRKTTHNLHNTSNTYTANFGRYGRLTWEVFNDENNKEEENTEYIVVQSIDRYGVVGYNPTKVSKEDSKGEGAMAIASLFLIYPSLREIGYDDESYFEDKTSFWERIGGDIDILKREDFFNYYNKKHETYEQGGVTEQHKKETYKKWKDLVNMSASELEKFMYSDEGREAGLSKQEADKLGIHYGRESAKWILKMKDTPVSEWTPNMWSWAKRQISFNSRMRGNKGKLYDDKGRKTRKHLSLLIWGHNPEKYEMGGGVEETKYGTDYDTYTIANLGKCLKYSNQIIFKNQKDFDKKAGGTVFPIYNSKDKYLGEVLWGDYIKLIDEGKVIDIGGEGLVDHTLPKSYEEEVSKYFVRIVFLDEQYADGGELTTFDSDNPDIRFMSGGEVSNYKGYVIKIEEMPSQVVATITQNGNYIGMIYLDDFPNNPYVAYSGIEDKHRGQGLGSYVYQLLDDYSFKKTGKNITHGDINSSISAIRLWRKRLNNPNYLPYGFYDYWEDDAEEVLKELNSGNKYELGGELTLTTEQVENKLGRKLHWWNDDVVSINGIEYKKVFLRNEYKRL